MMMMNKTPDRGGGSQIRDLRSVVVGEFPDQGAVDPSARFPQFRDSPHAPRRFLQERPRPPGAPQPPPRGGGPPRELPPSPRRGVGPRPIAILMYALLARKCGVGGFASSGTRLWP